MLNFCFVSVAAWLLWRENGLREIYQRNIQIAVCKIDVNNKNDIIYYIFILIQKQTDVYL